MSRAHLFLGIVAYGSSLIWLTFLVLGSLLTLGFHRTGLTWMPEPGFAASLGFPPSVQAAALLTLTIVLLFAPKLLAVLDLFLHRGAARGFGGAGRILLGVTLLSCLIAPLLMIFHAKFVVLTVLGRSVGWPAQQRAGHGTSWREAIATHAGQTIIGIIWGTVLALWVPVLFWWMLPIFAGLLLSIPLSVFTSRASVGRKARRLGLFVTPEESAPPPELQDLGVVVHALETEPSLSGVTPAVVDPYVNAIHVCLLRRSPRQAEDLRRHFAEKRELLLHDGPDALSRSELTALLSDVDSVDWLHREVWRRNPQELAPYWQEALHLAAPSPAPPATVEARAA
jgi:membrane glycosyltransferase